MRETRSAILESIKRRGSATVSDLAAEMAISPVTVRHHLYALMGDGLIERIPLRHGVGRPQHGYSLTDAGRRRFPSRYHVLTNHLLNVLKHVKSEADVEHLLETIVRQVLALPESADGLSAKQRLRQLERHFQEQDIPIRLSFEESQQHASLELACPYYYISQHHPELCRIDQKVIADILQLPMERTSCLLDGAKSCTFTIKLVDIQEPMNTGSD
ncbi:MAG: ArsR family transcriptional regulator [Anaerolineae bacterium]|nr:ArsR family transcriptional regulator [Anaerolineae bacterium]